MGIKINYSDGTSEFLADAVGAGKKRTDGKIDFCDDKGNVVKTVKDEAGLTWQPGDSA